MARRFIRQNLVGLELGVGEHERVKDGHRPAKRILDAGRCTDTLWVSGQALLYLAWLPSPSGGKDRDAFIDGACRLLFAGDGIAVEEHRPSGSQASGQSVSLYLSSKTRPTLSPALPLPGDRGEARNAAPILVRGGLSGCKHPRLQGHPHAADGTSTLTCGLANTRPLWRWPITNTRPVATVCGAPCP